MEIRQALKEQYHAGLAMLADCVAKCPDVMWTQGEHPRTFWRIVFHAAYFSQLYMGQNEAAFQPWPGSKVGLHDDLWNLRAEIEPYELPEGTEIYTRSEMLDYIKFVDALVDPTVDHLDLDTDDTGFSWYRNMGKLSHELLSLRHIQGHVGQLSELLMAKAIDTKWISKSSGLSLQ